MTKPIFPQHVVDAIEGALSRLYSRCAGLVTASVATKDGFAIGTFPPGSATTKLPVMAGTMHSLGDSIASECVLHECLNVTVEGSGGRMILLAVPGFAEELVLVAVASTQTSLGMLLCFGRDCCVEIASECGRLPQKEVAAR